MHPLGGGGVEPGGGGGGSLKHFGLKRVWTQVCVKSREMQWWRLWWLCGAGWLWGRRRGVRERVSPGFVACGRNRSPLLVRLLWCDSGCQLGAVWVWVCVSPSPAQSAQNNLHVAVNVHPAVNVQRGYARRLCQRIHQRLPGYEPGAAPVVVPVELPRARVQRMQTL